MQGVNVLALDAGKLPMLPVHPGGVLGALFAPGLARGVGQFAKVALESLPHRLRRPQTSRQGVAIDVFLEQLAEGELGLAIADRLRRVGSFGDRRVDPAGGLAGGRS